MQSRNCWKPLRCWMEPFLGPWFGQSCYNINTWASCLLGMDWKYASSAFLSKGTERPFGLQDQLLTFFWDLKPGNSVFIQCWPWGKNIGTFHFSYFSWKLRNKRDVSIVEILVLIAISRKTGDCICVLTDVTRVQRRKYFSRCAVRDSEMNDKLDWICIFYPLTFCRSNFISDVHMLKPERERQIFRDERIFLSSKFLPPLRLNWILVAWTYIQVSFRRWESWYNVLKWKLFQLWNTITYQATKEVPCTTFNWNARQIQTDSSSA